MAILLGPFPPAGGASPEVLERLDFIQQRLELIGTGVVRVAAPVAEDGRDIEVIRGDSYVAALGRSIELSSQDWPDLTDATVVMSAVATADGQTIIDRLPIGVVVPTATDDTPATVRIEWPSDLTATFPGGVRAMKFDLQSELPGGERVTLVLGFITVRVDITDDAGGAGGQP